MRRYTTAHSCQGSGDGRVTIGICTGGLTCASSIESSPEGEADEEEDEEGEEEEEVVVVEVDSEEVDSEERENSGLGGGTLPRLLLLSRPPHCWNVVPFLLDRSSGDRSDD